MQENISDYIERSTLYNEAKKIVIYRGAQLPKILFVGETPGKEEDKVGLPFVGRGGRILQGWISNFKLTPLTGMTYSIPLIPLNKTGSIRLPKPEEMAYFKPFIISIIKILKPVIVILLGNTATKMILGKSIDKARHQIEWKFGRFITAEYHPSWFLRRGQNGIDDFSWIMEHLIKQQFPSYFYKY